MEAKITGSQNQMTRKRPKVFVFLRQAVNGTFKRDLLFFNPNRLQHLLDARGGSL